MPTFSYCILIEAALTQLKVSCGWGFCLFLLFFGGVGLIFSPRMEPFFHRVLESHCASSPLPPPPVVAPPLLSRDEAPENPWGSSQGLPNHGLIQCYLIFLQTQDPHDVLGQCLFGEHISTPFVLQAQDPRTLHIFLLEVARAGREGGSGPRRHTSTSLSVMWVCCSRAWIQSGNCLCR